MNSLKRQQGAGFVFWVLFAALLGFLFIIGVRLFPVYLQGYSVKTILSDIAVESRGQEWKRAQYWNKLTKRFDVNSINGVKKEHFTYTREKGVTTLNINYERQFYLIANLDGVAKFDFTETVGADATQ